MGKTMEINSVKELQASVMNVTNPHTGAIEVGTTVTLAGPTHPGRRALELNQQRIARARINKKGRIELGDPLEDEADQMDKLVACTLDWSGLKRDGKPIECTTEEKR